MAEKEQTPLPVFKIVVLGLILSANNTSVWMIFSFLPFMVADFFPDLPRNELGFKAGILGSAFSAGGLLGNFFWGVLSDKIGRRPTLMCGLVGTAVSALGFGFSPTFFFAAFSRFMWGFLNGNIGVAKTYMAEICDDTNTARGMAMFGVIGGVGRTIGPVIGGFLSTPAEKYPRVFRGTIFDTYPFSLPCLIIALSCVLIFIVAYFQLPETLPSLKHRALTLSVGPIGRTHNNNNSSNRTSHSIVSSVSSGVSNGRGGQRGGLGGAVAYSALPPTDEGESPRMNRKHVSLDSGTIAGDRSGRGDGMGGGDGLPVHSSLSSTAGREGDVERGYNERDTATMVSLSQQQGVDHINGSVPTSGDMESEGFAEFTGFEETKSPIQAAAGDNGNLSEIDGTPPKGESQSSLRGSIKQKGSSSSEAVSAVRRKRVKGASAGENGRSLKNRVRFGNAVAVKVIDAPGVAFGQLKQVTREDKPVRVFTAGGVTVPVAGTTAAVAVADIEAGGGEGGGPALSVGSDAAAITATGCSVSNGMSWRRNEGNSYSYSDRDSVGVQIGNGLVKSMPHEYAYSNGSEFYFSPHKGNFLRGVRARARLLQMRERRSSRAAAIHHGSAGDYDSEDEEDEDDELMDFDMSYAGHMDRHYLGGCCSVIYYTIAELSDKIQYLIAQRDIRVSTMLYGLYAFAIIMASEIMPLWVVTSPSEGGGFSFSSSEIGSLVMFSGFVSICMQIFVYSKLVAKKGVLYVLGLANLLFAGACVLLPATSIINSISWSSDDDDASSIAGSPSIPLNNSTSTGSSSSSSSVSSSAAYSYTARLLQHWASSSSSMNPLPYVADLFDGTPYYSYSSTLVSADYMAGYPVRSDWFIGIDGVSGEIDSMSSSSSGVSGDGSGGGSSGELSSEQSSEASVLTWACVILIQTVLSVCCFWVMISVFFLINNSCYARDRATVNGIGQTFASIGRLCGPYIGSMLFAWSETNGLQWPLNYHFAFYVAACISLVAYRLMRSLPQSIVKRKIEVYTAGEAEEEEGLEMASMTGRSRRSRSGISRNSVLHDSDSDSDAEDGGDEDDDGRMQNHRHPEDSELSRDLAGRKVWNEGSSGGGGVSAQSSGDVVTSCSSNNSSSSFSDSNGLRAGVMDGQFADSVEYVGREGESAEFGGGGTIARLPFKGSEVGGGVGGGVLQRSAAGRV